MKRLSATRTKTRPVRRTNPLLDIVICVLAITALPVWSADVRSLAGVSPEGLRLVEESRHRVFYISPDTDWSAYRTVQVMDAQVAFKKNWERDYNRESGNITDRVTDQDVQRIKSAVAEMLKEILAEKFVRNRFNLVTEIGTDTLQIKPAIINLDVNAPDLMTATRKRTYVRSAGSGVLYLEIFDGVSGQILARVVDYSEAPDRGYFEWANRASNRAAARRVINQWADQLIDALEKVQKRQPVTAGEAAAPDSD